MLSFSHLSHSPQGNGTIEVMCLSARFQTFTLLFQECLVIRLQMYRKITCSYTLERPDAKFERENEECTYFLFARHWGQGVKTQPHHHQDQATPNHLLWSTRGTKKEEGWMICRFRTSNDQFENECPSDFTTTFEEQSLTIQVWGGGRRISWSLPGTDMLIVTCQNLLLQCWRIVRGFVGAHSHLVGPSSDTKLSLQLTSHQEHKKQVIRTLSFDSRQRTCMHVVANNPVHRWRLAGVACSEHGRDVNDTEQIRIRCSFISKWDFPAIVFHFDLFPMNCRSTCFRVLLRYNFRRLIVQNNIRTMAATVNCQLHDLEDTTVSSIRSSLLSWYDENKRDLRWRRMVIILYSCLYRKLVLPTTDAFISCMKITDHVVMHWDLSCFRHGANCWHCLAWSEWSEGGVKRSGDTSSMLYYD